MSRARHDRWLAISL